jgi:hypothetical protein
MAAKESPNAKPAISFDTPRLSQSEINALQEDKRQTLARIKELMARRKAEAADKKA